MKMRALAGLTVSEVALGTVSLGIDYGLPAPGEQARPSHADAIAVVRHALACGVTLFDTAPAYGASEAIVGEALAGRGIVATKVTALADDRAIRASVAKSRRDLRLSTLPLVQVHNATEALIASGDVGRTLLELRDEGAIAHIGASVYTEAEALAAIASGVFSTIQVPYNLLDRTMEARVFPAAQRANVGVLVRSAYLKGVLTGKVAWLPPELTALRDAVDALCRALGTAPEALPSLAVRFCLAHPAVSSVLIGARTSAELDMALAATGELDAETLGAIRGIEIADRRLLNPATWPAM